jgi:hypothetical protein
MPACVMKPLLSALEAISSQRPDRVLRLAGHLAGEPLELLIFRGFSSSTTHPTAFDPDQSALPDGARIQTASLLEGPLNPAAEQVLAGPTDPALFLEPAAWL